MGASWAAFAQELGLPSLRLAAPRARPGRRPARVRRAVRPRRRPPRDRRDGRVADLPRPGRRRRGRELGRRQARLGLRGARGRRAGRLARSSSWSPAATTRAPGHGRVAEPPPRRRALLLQRVGPALRQRAPAVRATASRATASRADPAAQVQWMLTGAPRRRRRRHAPAAPARRPRRSSGTLAGPRSSRAGIRPVAQRAAGRQRAAVGSSQFDRSRATCGSWSDAWSANSALTCTSRTPARPQQRRADQDVVERLRVALEHVRVALAAAASRIRLSSSPPSRMSSVSENSKSLRSPSTTTLAFVSAARTSRGEVVHDRRLLVPLRLGDADRRLEAAEQRVVAALGVEVVGDDEHRLALPRELAGERLAAVGERRVGRVDAARAERQLRAARGCRRRGRRRRRRRPAGRRTPGRGRCGTGSRRGCCRPARRRPGRPAGSIWR